MTEPQNDVRVLLVDDEPAVTSSLARSLRKEPFQILTSNSPLEALETLKESPVDVVLSDERMPGMSGSEFLARVRDLYPQTIRVMLTGEADLDAAVTAINDVEVYRFLTKPCAAKEVAACLAQAIERREMSRSYAEWCQTHKSMDRSKLEAKFESYTQALKMAYQPIVHAGDGMPLAFEALLRVQSEDQCSPTALVGMAEDLGKEHILDTIVRQRVAEDIQSAPEGSTIFINVHPASLNGQRFLGTDDPLLPFAERVVMEITERGSLREIANLQDVLAEARRKGYRIALDDLGAGYASLSSLAMLDPEYVKFDMELMRDVDRSRTRQKLVRAMTDLCSELGISTIGEGIETQAEREAGRSLGCTALQGYYFARPQFGFEVTWSGR